MIHIYTRPRRSGALLIFTNVNFAVIIVLYNRYIYILNILNDPILQFVYDRAVRRILIFVWSTMSSVKSVIFTARIKFFVCCKLKAWYCLFLC